MTRPEVDGLNAGYAALLLEQYLDNPSAVPPEWRALFESAPEELLAIQPGLARLLERSTGTAQRHVPRPRRPRRRRPRRHAPAPVIDDELLGGVAAAMSLVKAHPHARAPRRASRPARLGAARRSSARARASDPEADAGADGPHSRAAATPVHRGLDARGCLPAPARHLLRDDRVRDRAHLRSRRARVAPPGDRVGSLPAAALDATSRSGCSNGSPRSRGWSATFAARSSGRSSSRSKAST